MPEGERENVDSKLLGGRGGRRGGGQYKRDARHTHMHAHVSNNHRQNTKIRAHVDVFYSSSNLLSEFNKSPSLCSFGQIQSSFVNVKRALCNTLFWQNIGLFSKNTGVFLYVQHSGPRYNSLITLFSQCYSSPVLDTLTFDRINCAWHFWQNGVGGCVM